MDRIGPDRSAPILSTQTGLPYKKASFNIDDHPHPTRRSMIKGAPAQIPNFGSIGNWGEARPRKGPEIKGGQNGTA